MKNENKDNLTLSLAGVLENQSLNLIDLSRVSNPPKPVSIQRRIKS